MEAYLDHPLGTAGNIRFARYSVIRGGGEHMKGRLMLSLVLAALVALALAGAASAARLDFADHGGRSFSTVLTGEAEVNNEGVPNQGDPEGSGTATITVNPGQEEVCLDRKSTRLNSSHANISYAVFCLKKKKKA